MKYHVHLESQPSNSFRCQLAANSLDIDVKKKLKHELTVDFQPQENWSIGLIYGASGSGKTTLAKEIFKEEFKSLEVDQDKTILDQFPESVEYHELASVLSGVGLSQVPCWLRPVKTLSNGQQARATIAYAIIQQEGLIVVDEWTSVVDRTVAKVMSHCVQKYVRKKQRQIVLLSCHDDVINWLAPDWVIDCNTQTFKNYEPAFFLENEKNSFSELNNATKTHGKTLANIIILAKIYRAENCTPTVYI